MPRKPAKKPLWKRKQVLGPEASQQVREILEQPSALVAEAQATDNPLLNTDEQDNDDCDDDGVADFAAKKRKPRKS